MSNTVKILKKIRSHILYGIKHFCWLFYYSGREFFRDQCPTRAAALTFFTMLSLVPLLVILFAFFKTFGGESLIESAIKPFLFEALSTGTGEAVSGAIDQLLQQSRAGTLGAFGVIFLILTSFSLMEQTEFTLNAIWSGKRRRPLLQRWMFYWAALTIFPLLVGLSFSATAYLGSLKQVQELSEQVVPRGYNLFPLALQGLAFFLLYVFLPRTKVRFFPALGGAMVASIFWEFLKKGYLIYTSNAINYNVIYGSLATLPLFMIWLFISWVVILYGAEIAFTWQNYRVIGQTRKRLDVPFQICELIGLELLLESTRKFIAGGKSLNLEEFIAKNTLQPAPVYSTADKLIESGMLKSVEGELLLSRDPETLSVDDALDAVRMGGAVDPTLPDNGYFQSLHSIMGNLEKPSRKIKREWSMKRLLAEMEKMNADDKKTNRQV